jgi:acetate kinase
MAGVMPAPRTFILTLNAGSSSIKFAVFAGGGPKPSRVLSGQVERINTPGAQLVAKHGEQNDRLPIKADTHEQAAESVAEYLHRQLGREAIAAIGHRIVHGGLHLLEHQLITPAVIDELKRSIPMDLAHLPTQIALIEVCGKSFPGLPQVACFDTAFFRDLPTVSRLLPIPRPLSDGGIRRFGFHGLSYTYLMQRLAEVAGAEAANGRVILAHLGAGASLAAVHGGKPIDTTMSFTPIAGLVMATRPGDLDPGLITYLMRQEHLTAEAMDEFLAEKCGLLGISQTSGDVRDLLDRQSTDPRAAEAIDSFCYAAKKHVASLAAALGGLDSLVFAGGIGEHAPAVRARICAGLDFIGIQLDSAANDANRDVLSSPASRVTVRRIPTDEEIIIAQATRAILDRGV